MRIGTTLRAIVIGGSGQVEADVGMYVRTSLGTVEATSIDRTQLLVVSGVCRMVVRRFPDTTMQVAFGKRRSQCPLTNRGVMRVCECGCSCYNGAIMASFLAKAESLRPKTGIIRRPSSVVRRPSGSSGTHG